MTRTTFFRLLKTPRGDKGKARADLGYGVLDTAMVETAAYVVRRLDAVGG